VKDLKSLSLSYTNNQLSILNQQKLPLELEWIVCESPTQMRDIIFALQVRGAPLIGVAAAVALAKYVEDGASREEIIEAARILKSARPTAVNLAHCIDRQMAAFENTHNAQAIVKMAEELFDEDKKLCDQIAQHGTKLFESGDNVLTHCNTGGLVTAGVGTALGVIFHAHQQGKKIHVYVDETRPLLQGARLTTWELQRGQVPYTLICDNMAASLMRAGKVQKIIVGADRIATNGDFANKIGTYSLAVLAHHHKIPFYVAAPYTTIDFACKKADEIVVEQRSADEVRGYGDLNWSALESPVYNPSFDVTPGELVTAFILDQGVFGASELVGLKGGYKLVASVE
jgi:methylthioribose-1-phosphate isomerase